MAWTWCLGLAIVAAFIAACTPAPTTNVPASAPSPAATGVPPAARPAEAASGAASAAPSAGASARQVAAPLNPPRTVRVAYTQSSGEVPLYLGIEHGYFAELGIAVELVRIPGSADTIVLLTTDQLEAGGLLITPAFYNAAARNVGVRMVADRGSNLVSPSSFSLAVRADLLAQRPWSGYQDLRGLKVAVPQLGSMAEYYLERMLQRASLQIGEVELIAPLTFPDMAAAFANRGIDAALYLEPWATIQEEEGIIRKVSSAVDVAPGSHTAALVYGDTFARDAQAARNFMVGWLRAVRHLTDATDGRRDPQDVVEATRTYTAIKDEALIRKLPPTLMNPNGYLDPANLATYQDWFAGRGLVPQKADIARVYDPAFAEYANTVLGPYQPVENAPGPARSERVGKLAVVR